MTLKAEKVTMACRPSARLLPEKGARSDNNDDCVLAAVEKGSTKCSCSREDSWLLASEDREGKLTALLRRQRTVLVLLFAICIVQSVMLYQNYFAGVVVCAGLGDAAAVKRQGSSSSNVPDYLQTTPELFAGTIFLCSRRPRI